LKLGEPNRAIPMPEASQRDLPGDYNPPARLAVALKATKRWDDAPAASDGPLSKAYGPRRPRIRQTRAERYSRRGDRRAARRARHAGRRRRAANTRGAGPAANFAQQGSGPDAGARPGRRPMTLYLSGTVGDENLVWPLDAEIKSIGRSSKNGIHVPDAT